ncbi:hypothetical protein PTKIN_Ptkin08bG0015200 [Pterospermum kingtungense]
MIRIQKHIAFIFYYVFVFIHLSTAGLLKCYDTGNFTSNSTYGKNLDMFWSSLPDNVSANGGFYKTTIGQGLNQVYGLGLCRGDASPGACSSCISLRVREIKASCPNQTEAILWEGEVVCLVRYSDRSIFGTLELEPIQAGYNTKDVTDVTSNVTRFYEIWDNLMDGLVERASNGSSKLKFSTGIADVGSEKIYGLMQCTPDISQRDCRECLMETVGQYRKCCQGKQGGYVLTPNCHFRWDLYSIFNSSTDTFYLQSQLPPLPPPPPPPPHSATNGNTSREDNGGLESQVVVIIVVPIIFSIGMLVGLAYMLLRKRKRTKRESMNNYNNNLESLLFDFSAIKVATDNFSENNKLGQGGFGSVYKGRLYDGQDIAVKRLSGNSLQGDWEFKNEVQLTAKLQHRNLVRLLGFSLEGTERLLIYELLPNSSLDHFLFNPDKRLQLDWDKRHNIITGIARGMLYLHEDSQYRIVHRDLKASNVLLDDAMNPKIADFGMARLFAEDKTHDATSKPAGTYAYMAPEYIRRGTYSVKSDVYSFGVLVLEIIIGEKINYFHSKEVEDLLTHAWKSWKRGTVMDMIDPILMNGSRMEILRCIHVGLLCVQAKDISRPTMTSVVMMLSSYSMPLPLPSRPAFVDITNTMDAYQVADTVNEASISELDPR